MNPLHWLAQFLSYSPFCLAAFVLFPLFFTLWKGVAGGLFGHALVSAVMVISDGLWIDAEMSKPNWNGTPDMDGIFWVGVCLRLMTLNSMILPLDIVGRIIFLRWNKRQLLGQFDSKKEKR